jgi:glycosyltransferase involved in cell wall biosynthesis
MDTKPLKVAVALLTYNRINMLVRTLGSLKYPDYPYTPVIVDNGSTDGSAELVKEIGGICNTSGNHTTGRGMNIAITEAMQHKPDLILFTADDFIYRKAFMRRLVDFWQDAPQDIIMASCYLEPSWSWNEILKVDTAGGQRYAIRKSIPGSNWSFRASDVDKIFPVSEQTGGEDLAVCERLRRQRYTLAALDLVDHIGEEQSAWGNESWKYAQPLDKVSLGFEEWTQ